MKIGLVSVPVNDPMAAFKFYTEVLGFVERVYMPEHYLAIVASPEAPDGTQLLLEPNQHPVSKAFQQGVYELGMPIIVFNVDNLEQEMTRLKAKGVKFQGEPAQEGPALVVNLDDTCGNFIQLAQMLPQE